MINFLKKLLFNVEEDKLTNDSKDYPCSKKNSSVCCYRDIFRNCLFSILLVILFLSWMDVLLYANRELGLNIHWLSDFYISRMNKLNLSHEEIYNCFSLLHIIIGVSFMLEPLLEIVYFKYEVSKLRPKGRMMTGLECFTVTQEIEKKFYSSSLSLMSRSRKILRKVVFVYGTVLTMSWFVIHTISY